MPPIFTIRVTGVEIGDIAAATTLTAIEYFGDRLLGSGPGGDHLTPLVVPNTTQPVGIVDHHKHWEVVIGLNEDEYTALFDTAVDGVNKAVSASGPNSKIGWFKVNEKSNAGMTRTIVYESDKVYVQAVETNKVTNEEGKYVVEVKFICIGSRTVPAWA